MSPAAIFLGKLLQAMLMFRPSGISFCHLCCSFDGPFAKTNQKLLDIFAWGFPEKPVCSDLIIFTFSQLEPALV
jgi:hypothetical protein